MLGELEDLTSSKTIEAPDDLAEYGLDETECSISVTAEAETTIDIGGETSLNGLRYGSIGDGNVYLVSSDLLTNFSCGLYDLVSKEAIPDMSDLVSFTVETASGTLDIEYLEDSGLAYTDRYTWFSLADREYTALDNELTEDLVSLVTGLSWGECVDYDAVEALLAWGEVTRPPQIGAGAVFYSLHFADKKEPGHARGFGVLISPRFTGRS